MRLFWSLLAISLFACTEYEVASQIDDVDDPIPPAEEGAVPGEPVADAGVDFTARPLDTVALDGTASYDPLELAITSYQWSLVSQPPGSTAALRSPSTVMRRGSPFS